MEDIKRTVDDIKVRKEALLGQRGILDATKGRVLDKEISRETWGDIARVMDSSVQSIYSVLSSQLSHGQSNTRAKYSSLIDCQIKGGLGKLGAFGEIMKKT